MAASKRAQELAEQLLGINQTSVAPSPAPAPAFATAGTVTGASYGGVEMKPATKKMLMIGGVILLVAAAGVGGYMLYRKYHKEEDGTNQP